MKRSAVPAIIAIILCAYIGTIVIGLSIRNFSWLDSTPLSGNRSVWQAPRLATVPLSAKGDSIRYGALLFDETPLYAPEHTGASISCTSCHAEGGIQPFASPMVGLPALFPMFNKRAGHIISLQDRIQECFVRSENGKPLDYKGAEMQAIVDYINWLSEPQPGRRKFAGRGLLQIPDLKPDPVNGATIYAAQCAGCHGTDGNGTAPMFPALWGSRSFNDGAGMDNLQKMAAFVQHNMPQNRMGILTPQQAYDVSAYVQSQPRPAFNPAYKHF